MEESLNLLRLRSGFIIYPSQTRKIDTVLRETAQKIPARFILLADNSGQVISSAGNYGETENIVALGSLAAGYLAASREIAHMLGEYDEHQMVLREGEKGHTFITEAGHNMVLLVNINAKTPLGWARMLILQTAQHLASIAEAQPEEIRHNSNDLEPNESVSNTEENLSALFGDALNALWSGEED